MAWWGCGWPGRTRSTQVVCGSGPAGGPVDLSVAVDDGDGHRRADRTTPRHRIRPAAAAGPLDPVGGSGAVRMLPGQTLDDYAAVADRLAQTFGVEDCRVRSVPKRRHELELWLLIADPLAQIVAPFPPDPDCLTKGLPVALAEDGTVWRLRLLGTHVLVVGATGAGRGSVIWSILAALAEPIGAGLVKVWAVDPKGGMELAAGAAPVRPVLLRRQPHRPAAMRSRLRRAPRGRRAGDAGRQDRLRGVTRLHEPSTAEPLIVLVVDELAALTAWTIDRTARNGSPPPSGCCSPKAEPSASSSSGRCRTPARTSCRNADLFPPGSRCGCPKPSRSTWSWAPGHGTGARSVTRSPTPSPASATSRSTASPNPSGSGSPTSPTTTSPSSADQPARCRSLLSLVEDPEVAA